MFTSNGLCLPGSCSSNVLVMFTNINIVLVLARIKPDSVVHVKLDYFNQDYVSFRFTRIVRGFVMNVTSLLFELTSR